MLPISKEMLLASIGNFNQQKVGMSTSIEAFEAQKLQLDASIAECKNNIAQIDVWLSDIQNLLAAADNPAPITPPIVDTITIKQTVPDSPKKRTMSPEQRADLAKRMKKRYKLYGGLRRPKTVPAARRSAASR